MQTGDGSWESPLRDGFDHFGYELEAQVRRVLDVTSALSGDVGDDVLMRLLDAVRGTHNPSTTAARTS